MQIHISLDIYIQSGFLMNGVAKAFTAVSILLYIFLGSTIRVFEEWRRNELKKRKIQEERNMTELKALKNQINPHFLFNSLNNIYSLVVKESKKAPMQIIMLSDLMRYMLYQTDDEFVYLKSEIEYLQNYVALQKMRLYNNAGVRLQVIGELEGQRIRPLLFVSIVENAFKYGTYNVNDVLIEILFKIKGNNIYFECRNKIGGEIKETADSGIGLKNTKERFELLYPDKHDITIRSTDEIFEIGIHLNLI
ncbi:sensor histidine kinase [Euzebyella marina]|nr:histidine kinase [Euzebyella marina]